MRPRPSTIAAILPIVAASASVALAMDDDAARSPAGKRDPVAATHWSYRPILRPSPPAIEGALAARSPIDRFIHAELARHGLAPQEPADRALLARRAALGLIGLTPDPAFAADFIAGERPDAWERYVDRLLASPAFGERWARVWLDLARYADTNGYEKDGRRTIWRYRDWVIDAFNADMPFDRFTIEQLAGDLLPDPSMSQQIATAFHRNTMTNTEGGTDNEEFRVAAVVDRTNTTMQVWMGSTAGCAQCHHHKYDPIAQEEYYQLFAFFDQTADADLDDNAPTLETPTADEERERARLAGRVATLERELAALAAEAADDADRAKLGEELAAAKKALDAFRPTTTPILRELEGDRRRETHVHLRGSFLDRGPRVEPGTPAAFHALPDGARANRLALAEWIVSPSNPLTARVLANRVWEQLFGIGIVETSEDFGTQGSPPSHPELLDWLAAELIARRWSLKALCREIVLSDTYRQASRACAAKLAADPRNRLLSRGPRFRLPAETLRDQALAASGLLSRKIGGPSVMPPQPDGIWAVVYSGDTWMSSEGADRHRRGLYTFWRRTSPYPSMMAFDATSREVCTIRRIRTNTPLQALVTLNDPAFVEAAQALARLGAREEREAHGGDDDDRDAIDAMFRRVLVRSPTPAESARLLELVRDARAMLAAAPGDAAALATGTLGALGPGLDAIRLAALTVAANVILNLDETLTQN